MELEFKSDTKYRKQYFTGLHFSHPAKMHLSLQMWLIDNYTQPGEVILDPMAGSGTVLVACMMGRDVVAVELEDKFVTMQLGNWEKIRQRGPMLGFEMGEATILQGDARNLEGLLVDKIITSPPYAETLMADRDRGKARVKRLRSSGHNDIADRIEKVDNWHQHEGDYNPDNPDNLGNLPYGSIDKVITSPPYSERMDGGMKDTPSMLYTDEKPDTWFTQRDKRNIGNLPHGNIDSIITSPPYEESVHSTGQSAEKVKSLGSKYSNGSQAVSMEYGYSEDQANIGNLKSDSYLSAMLQVYQQCYLVLKNGGLLILVTKNFIRNKQEVRLDEDTIKLCKSAGFTFKERHYRKLTQQSFWRVIYQQKYPDAPVLNKEDILVFTK